MGDITELLRAAQSGDSRCLDAVFAQVYATLRSLAASRLAAQSGEHTPARIPGDSVRPVLCAAPGTYVSQLGSSPNG